MTQRNVFLALPEELYAEANEAARLRQISLADFLVEALSDSIEAQNERRWLADQGTSAGKVPMRIH